MSHINSPTDLDSVSCSLHMLHALAAASRGRSLHHPSLTALRSRELIVPPCPPTTPVDEYDPLELTFHGRVMLGTVRRLALLHPVNKTMLADSLLTILGEK